MNCEHAKDQLVDYLSRQLSDAEQAALTAHLAECADCRAELQATQRLWQNLGAVRPPEPSEHLRPEFYAMLASFKEEVKATPDYSLKGLWQWWLNLEIPRPILRAVYSLCLVAVGLIGGYWLNNKPAAPAGEQEQLATLSAQVKQMRQVMVLSLIDNPSATERLRAVSYTKDMSAPNGKVVSALLSTLDNDPNVNVRLATLEALAPLAADPTVRLGLVHSLPKQDSPLVQAALADVMVQLQERRSVQPLRQLLEQPNLDETVKDKIEQSIQTIQTGRPAAPQSSPRHDQTRTSAQPELAATLAV
ncbi:zf-HC2 domain-containing protein [Hymenobacter properus]|uniref:HEAT repeat domain-containing protein n=1 Tax=Hymenobacter properus TaxID=2791026 RepID=A0A931BLU1_9BACT|nr:HEAT repeat domain-containing protein [Hymenobacter properus]MBF9143711.1 HEAT repeat domain-containing protein [Hymenobacter properus]MBR7722524.1 HEAT repeat domain-containing protein [Microvirga sp. SRT04]